MALLTLLDAELAYGLHPLLDRAGFTVLEGERVGLIGRNGTGKTSLLKVIAGLAALDDGELKRRDGLRVVLVEQKPELPLASTLRESLAPSVARSLKGPAAIVITHDRAFLDRVVNRIVELDRGLLRSYPGNFAAYERRKADRLATEGVAHRKFDRFWAQEEAWIRRGIKARRTRNEGRVRRLEQLRRERAARRECLGQVKLTLDAGERSGRLVAELCGVSKCFGERTIVQDLSLCIQRGDRLGLIGPNGAGKSTLLKLILGRLVPDAGEVRLGTNLQVAYFDQMREQLDPEHTLLDTISPGSDWVQIGAERKHVMTYLADFLFLPQRAKAPVKMLSGGERNRLCSRASSRVPPTCWCSTNLPTISTSNRSSCLKTPCRATPERCSL
jgi:ATPase subunit of ABC transporter with duplicated ATPase domains